MSHEEVAALVQVVLDRALCQAITANLGEKTVTCSWFEPHMTDGFPVFQLVFKPNGTYYMQEWQTQHGQDGHDWIVTIQRSAEEIVLALERIENAPRKRIIPNVN